MKGQPRVSVVTPTLNQAPFLERTLASVRGQTYPNIEHIVIDGGSTDGTLDMLRRESDDGSIRYLSEPDDGMYEAVNKGLHMATGEVLAYLNSDDAWLPWAIETAMRVFDRRPDVDVVFGDGIKVEHETGIQRLRLLPPFDRRSLASYDSLLQPAVFWRRRLFERLGGFDPSMRFVGDLDYWLRAAESGATIAHVREVLAIDRIHAGRLSASRRDAMAVEDAAMRARHAGPDGGPADRERARLRHAAWERRLLRRFALASLIRHVPVPLPLPWSRFLRDGRARVRVRQVLEASQSHQHRALRNAAVSGLVADIVGAAGRDAEPAPGPKRRAGLPRRMIRRGRRVLRRAARAAARAWRRGTRPIRYRRNELGLALTYRFSSEGRRSSAALRRLHGSVTSRRCVIIGNGPSLNEMDLSVLKDEQTFGLNRGYLLFPRIGRPTSYLVSANRYVLEQSIDEMLAAPGLKFFNWRHRRYVPAGRDDVIFLHTVHQPGFSLDIPGRGLWEGATVTFVAMQLAYHLGYRDVVLIGVDHSFSTPGPAHQLVTSEGADPNHFDPSYFGAGYRWQLPDLEMSERAYLMAKEAFEAAGGSVVDATVGGKLTIFPKADFTALFPTQKAAPSPRVPA